MRLAQTAQCTHHRQDVLSGTAHRADVKVETLRQVLERVASVRTAGMNLPIGAVEKSIADGARSAASSDGIVAQTLQKRVA